MYKMTLEQRVKRLEQIGQAAQDKNNGNKMANMVITWQDGTVVFDGRKFNDLEAAKQDPAFHKDGTTIILPDNGRK